MHCAWSEGQAVVAHRLSHDALPQHCSLAYTHLWCARWFFLGFLHLTPHLLRVLTLKHDSYKAPAWICGTFEHRSVCEKVLSVYIQGVSIFSYIQKYRPIMVPCIASAGNFVLNSHHSSRLTWWFFICGTHNRL